MTEFAVQIQELLGARVRAGEPGVAVGVYRDGELAEQVCAGLAAVEHGAPVTPDTLFDIASASKQVTAACLLLLRREGRLDLGDDVRRYVPELALGEPVTLRQCLTHTGGLREYYVLCAISGVPLHGITEERLLRLIEGQRDLDFPPGSAYSYSNTGYVLAAVVIRRLTGKSVAEFAAERIFAPLGMARTHFRDDLGAPVPGLATGYAPDPATPGRFRRADPIEEVVGDGGVVTSVRELAAWHAFLLTGRGLGADIRDGLLPRAVLTGGRTLHYANGLAHTTEAGQAGYGHTGAISGFRSVLLCIPAAGLGVSVLTNRIDIYPALVARWVVRLALGVPVETELTDPVPAEVAEPARSGLLGRWHDPVLDMFVRLEPGPGGRLEQPGPGGERFRFALAADGRWYGEGAGASIALQLDRDRLGGDRLGRDRLLVRPAIGDDDYETFERAQIALPPPGPGAPPAGRYFSPELDAYATFDPDGDAGPAVTIGLNRPWRLASAGPDVYVADDWLTVRFTGGGQTLLVSADGARLVRFSRVAAEDSSAPVYLRGLRQPPRLSLEHRPQLSGHSDHRSSGRLT
jgi:CubicO group peptidase (beta-lactamase class C family)